MNLQDEFGDIDIYVFDQLLRGRIVPGMRVFDAGCGGGRNLVYLLREGYEVCGNDADAGAIAAGRARWPRRSLPGARTTSASRRSSRRRFPTRMPTS